jgi:uncharacterized protein YbcI
MTPPKARTKGEHEAEFTRAMIQFEKEYLGRGPEDVRTVFVLDMVVVRIRGILTRAELKLCETTDGRELVKETRRKLFESAYDIVADMVKNILGCALISLHTDMSTKTGERVVVLTVNVNLDEQFGR